MKNLNKITRKENGYQIDNSKMRLSNKLMSESIKETNKILKSLK